MSGYQGRHRKHATPDELPAILRGLADQIEVVPGKGEEQR